MRKTKGGSCGTSMCAPAMPMTGGGCPCAASSKLPVSGGYRKTKRNSKYLKLWKKGKSIGFTMISSLKAKGLIPRANGTKRVSRKYR